MPRSECSAVQESRQTRRSVVFFRGRSADMILVNKHAEARLSLDSWRVCYFKISPTFQFAVAHWRTTRSTSARENFLSRCRIWTLRIPVLNNLESSIVSKKVPKLANNLQHGGHYEAHAESAPCKSPIPRRDCVAVLTMDRK